MKLRTALLTLLAVSSISTAQTEYPSDGISGYDRFKEQLETTSTQARYVFLATGFVTLEEAHDHGIDSLTTTEENKKDKICAKLRDKFTQLGFAAANMQYREAFMDFKRVRQEIQTLIQQNTKDNISCNLEDY